VLSETLSATRPVNSPAYQGVALPEATSLSQSSELVASGNKSLPHEAISKASPKHSQELPSHAELPILLTRRIGHISTVLDRLGAKPLPTATSTSDTGPTKRPRKELPDEESTRQQRQRPAQYTAGHSPVRRIVDDKGNTAPTRRRVDVVESLQAYAQGMTAQGMTAQSMAAQILAAQSMARQANRSTDTAGLKHPKEAMMNIKTARWRRDIKCPQCCRVVFWRHKGVCPNCRCNCW
jgi:hypothetical protein